MKTTVMMRALAFGASTFAAMSAHAAIVNNGDILTITTGVPAFDTNGNQSNVTSGSWFSLDTVKPDSKIQDTEKHQISQGTKGIVIGSAQPVGEIDAEWNLGGIPGQHYTSAPITGDTVGGLNMSGFRMLWFGAPVLLDGGAWNPGNCVAAGVNCSNIDNVGKFTWDGVYGHAYTLDFAAIPTQPASTFRGIPYYLHLTGTVTAAPVPVPAAAWLLGSGLVGLVGIARRRKVQA